MFETLDPTKITLDTIRAWFGGALGGPVGPMARAVPHLMPGQSLTVSSGQTVGKQGLSSDAAYYANAYQVSRAFYDGDHWQNGQGWAGQFPLRDGTSDVDPDAFQRMAQAFTSENVIATCADRHTAAVVGRSPSRRLYTDGVDDAANDPLAARNAVLEGWGERRNVLAILQDYVLGLLLAGQSSVRLWMPPAVAARAAGVNLAELTPGQPIVLPAMSYEDALALLRPAYVEPGEGGVYEDPETGDRYSGIAYQAADGSGRGEVAYLDEQGRTVVVVLTETDRYPQAPVDLGGALPVYTRRRRPLITEQVRQQQRMLNKAYTMANTNLDWSAFVERIFLNGKPPTSKDAAGNDVPVYKPGPATASFISGQVFIDQDGNEKLSTPQVVFREPGKPEVFQATVALALLAILREVYQVHAMLSGDAAPSGESRIQAKAEFIVSLLLTKPAVDGAGRHLFETADRWACALAGEPVQDGARHTFRTRIDPGPMSPEEIRAIVEKVREKLMSHRAALAELRAEDVEAELAAIEADALGTPEARAKATKAFVDAGLSLYNALLAAGYDEEEATNLADYTNGDPTPPAP